MRWKIAQTERLVGFLQAQVGGSGKGIRRILEANGCRVNGCIERFGSAWVKTGDVVEFVPQELATGNFAVLFENEELLIVDKPAGWVCDDKHCRKSFGSGMFLVHRLDKDTTGALLLAKNGTVRDALMELFADRSVEKEYLALVDGTLRGEEGVRESLLARKGSFQGQTIWGSRSSGDQAVTCWKTLATGDKASFVLCKPLTGRTHQIRVHMSEMGHPILVDRQYAEKFRSTLFAPRPLLHAGRLSFLFKGERIEASAPMPADFQKALSAVGIQDSSALSRVSKSMCSSTT
jgi:23S rRNA pseudouridine955/2504/2580 synthase/23S rRNA pseudouridine1911/1915/1917 synthase